MCESKVSVDYSMFQVLCRRRTSLYFSSVQGRRSKNLFCERGRKFSEFRVKCDEKQAGNIEASDMNKKQSCITVDCVSTFTVRSVQILRIRISFMGQVR